MEIPHSLNSAGRGEGATSSTPESVNPVTASHNMNDLKVMDFNSADEVRQAMKVMLSGKLPQNSGDEGSLKPTGHPNDETKEDAAKNPDILKSNHAIQNMTDAVIKIFNTSERRFAGTVKRKRPGRPPKAGPSKRAKKASVTFLYIGKLSNVVKFKHHASGSESDDYYY